MQRPRARARPPTAKATAATMREEGSNVHAEGNASGGSGAQRGEKRAPKRGEACPPKRGEITRRRRGSGTRRVAGRVQSRRLAKPATRCRSQGCRLSALGCSMAARSSGTRVFWCCRHARRRGGTRAHARKRGEMAEARWDDSSYISSYIMVIVVCLISGKVRNSEEKRLWNCTEKRAPWRSEETSVDFSEHRPP